MVRFDDAYFKEFYEKLASEAKGKSRGYLERKSYNHNKIQLTKKVNRLKRDNRRLIDVVEYLVEKNKALTKEIFDLKYKN